MIQVDELMAVTASEEGFSRTRQRQFRVWTGSVDGALAAPGVPVRGDDYPHDTSMIALSRNAFLEKDLDACIVQVGYGIPEVAGGDGADDQTPFDTIRQLGRVSMDIRSELVQQNYPLLRPRWISTPPLTLSDPPAPPSQRLGWGAFEATSERVVTSLTVRTAFVLEFLPTLAGLFSAFTPISQQTGRLHIIGGKLYRFECRMLNQATEGAGEVGTEVWNAEYTWTSDPGVPAPNPLPDGWEVKPGNSIGSDNIRMPSLPYQAAPNERFVIPPFSEPLYDELELENASLTDPTFFGRMIPTIDANGYAALPGIGAG